MEVQRILYIAGPYRALTVNGIWRNVHHSRRWVEVVIAAGWGAIDPLATTAFMDGLVADSQFLAVDTALLERLRPGQDGILLRPGWEDSKGANTERELAVQRGLFILYTETMGVEKAAEWLYAHRHWPDEADEVGT